LLEHAASATLAGSHAQPTLVLTVRANQDADLAIIRRRIRQEAMPRLCQALELSSLPAQVEFHYTAKSQSAVNGRRNRQVGVVDKHEADPSSARRPCGGARLRFSGGFGRKMGQQPGELVCVDGPGVGRPDPGDRGTPGELRTGR
jgi:hypothetical protein